MADTTEQKSPSNDNQQKSKSKSKVKPKANWSGCGPNGTDVIRIHCDEKGNFTYEPATYRATAGSRICFQCAVGNFAIQFPNTPLGTLELHGKKGEIRGPFPVGKVRGRYHYMVAVAVGDKIFMDTGSPVIVIS